MEVKTRIHNMLEVRLLYRKLKAHNVELELAVAERTAELRESEARFRALTELASDWYWEQDAAGELVKVSGPVMDMLGIRIGPLAASTTDAGRGWPTTRLRPDRAQSASGLHRLRASPSWTSPSTACIPDGSRHQYRVSGQPMFDQACRFLGYRGIGVEIMAGM